MANCRACGGRLGLDCLNEADCLQIQSSNEYDSYRQMDENYISILIYKLEQNNISIPNWISPEPPLIMKTPYGCENKYIDDGLPF